MGIPIVEQTLLNIIQFPFNNLPISSSEVLEILEHLICRALTLLKSVIINFF